MHRKISDYDITILHLFLKALDHFKDTYLSVLTSEKNAYFPDVLHSSMFVVVVVFQYSETKQPGSAWTVSYYIYMGWKRRELIYPCKVGVIFFIFYLK